MECATTAQFFILVKINSVISCSYMHANMQWNTTDTCLALLWFQSIDYVQFCILPIMDNIFYSETIKSNITHAISDNWLYGNVIKRFKFLEQFFSSCFINCLFHSFYQGPPCSTSNIIFTTKPRVYSHF